MAPPQRQALSSVSWQGRVLPLIPGSVAWEGPESWTEAGSSGEAAAISEDSNAQALALC